MAAPGDTSLLPRAGVRGFPHWGTWLQVLDMCVFMRLCVCAWVSA